MNRKDGCKEMALVWNIGETIVCTILAAVALFLSSASAQTSSPVDIEEKLGSQVALDTVLKDEDGNEITLRRLVNKPAILMFNYFRCPGICPIIISNAIGVVNKMKLEPGKDYELVAVSFDPADTPKIARDKKANYLNQLRRPFKPDSWHFLTGTAENSKAVADSAGFHYLRQGDLYVHPGAIMVLTPKGILSRYLYGTEYLPADVEMAIREAAGGQVRPTISKFLSFCYVSAPQGRGYVFSVTRFVGAAILVIAGIFVIIILKGKPKETNR
jgi:protein SCO1